MARSGVSTASAHVSKNETWGTRHHLHGSPVPTSDLRGQVLPKDRHLLAIRRANMRRKVKVSLSPVFTALRSKPDQIGKLACCQPRHPAAVIHSPECQASVTIEAVPAQVGFLELFAAHGLHGIPEDRLHMSDFHEHLRSESTQQIGLFPRSGIPFCVSDIGIAGETEMPIFVAGTMQLAST